jgi:hypothetical protein
MSDAYVMLKEDGLRDRFMMGAACGWDNTLFERGKLMKIDREAAIWLRDNVPNKEAEISSGKAFHVWMTAAECRAGLQKLKLAKLGRTQPVVKERHEVAPPRLKSAAPSHLADPPASHAIELEQLEELEELEELEDPIDLGEEVEPGDYDDIVSDDDITAAAKEADQPKPKAKKRAKRKPASRKKRR